jgi:hypothetical protein
VPIQADIEAATPCCQATRLELRPGGRNFGLRGGTTRYLIELLCLKPMRYRASDNTWLCECGSTETGALIAARARAFDTEPKAQAA